MATLLRIFKGFIAKSKKCFKRGINFEIPRFWGGNSKLKKKRSILKISKSFCGLNGKNDEFEYIKFLGLIFKKDQFEKLQSLED